MKIKNYCILFALLLALLLACDAEKDEIITNTITVTGQFDHVADTSLIFTYEPYTLLASSQTASIEIDSSGHFEMAIESSLPLKGFLTFKKVPRIYSFDITQVNGRDSCLDVESVDFRAIYLYLMPGDNLNMEADIEDIKKTLTFTGTGSDNNNFVNFEEWNNNSYKIKYLKNYYYLTYCEPVNFKVKTKELRNKKHSLLRNFQSEHKLSNHLIRVYENQYYQDYIRALIYYPAGHAGFNDDQYPELPENYYDFLADVAIPDSIDDLGPGAFYYLKSALKKKYELNNSIDKESVDYYDYLATQIPERLVYVYKALSLERDFRKETYSVFNSDDCPYPDIATLVQKRFKHLEGMLEGAPGPDFTLTDPTGKIVSLNDLKGKYIYIDFWATWCGPCIKEIPSLEKIQHEYRDAPIHFVSISFDQERDSLKWKDYVAEHELKGIQLFADKNQHEILSSRLNIKTIPRFVLLDTEGKMINAKAPRPSNPQLKNVLNELTKH